MQLENNNTQTVQAKNKIIPITINAMVVSFESLTAGVVEFIAVKKMSLKFFSAK